ncbi:MAG: class I SAM-dependent methyltransferase [Terriglobia bacterium]
MATDYNQIMQNIREFYDFSGKEVLAVGAGGGQLIELGRGTGKLIAIDKDLAAIRQLEARIAAQGLQDQVEIVNADFCETSRAGDVVYFEFSLHEMDDPEQALRHAATLAPDVLIFDHLPDSPWAFYAVEEDKVRHSNSAMTHFECVRQKAFHTEQRFQDHAQLVEKVSCQGALAIERARQFLGKTNIVIPMTYGLTLLAGAPRAHE